jgi:hypothetical protein
MRYVANQDLYDRSRVGWGRIARTMQCNYNMYLRLTANCICHYENIKFKSVFLPLIFILRFKETESSLENTYVRLNPTQYDL